MTKLGSFLIFLISFSGSMILIYDYDSYLLLLRRSKNCFKSIKRLHEVHLFGISFSFPSIKNKTKLYYTNLIQLICPVYSQALFLGQWNSLSRGGGVLNKWYSTTIFHEKGTPFLNLLLTNGTPFTYLV